MKRTLRIVIPLIIVAGLVAAIAVWQSVASIPQVDTEIVAKGPVEETVEETAEAVFELSQVVSTQAGGILGRVLVDVGDFVQGGALIATIDPTDLDARIMAAKAQVAALEAQVDGVDALKPKKASFDAAQIAVEAATIRLDMAQKQAAAMAEEMALVDKNLKRARALFSEGLSQQAQLDQIESQARSLRQQAESSEKAVAAARNEIAAAKAAENLLKEAENDPEYARRAYRAQAQAAQAAILSLEFEKARLDVRAPFAGVVLERMTRGSLPVAPGTPVILVGDPDSMEVEAEVLSDDVTLVALGQKAEVFGGALGEKRFDGKVSRIFPSAFAKISSLGIEQRRVKVRITVPDGTGLNHGYRVEARIIVKSIPEAVRVSTGSVFRRDGKDCLLVLLPENKLRLAAVKKGLSNEEWTEIIEGVRPGERVVRDPREELKEGTKVKIAEGKARR